MINEITLGAAWGWILAAAAAVVALDKAWQVIAKKLKPSSDLRVIVQQQGQMLEECNKRIKSNEEFQGILCQAMIAQFNHILSGNDVNALKSSRDDLTKYLATKRRDE